MSKPELHNQPWKDPGLSWSQLRAFEACARLSSFNAAAAELNLTASAIRYQAGLLEGRIGVKLLERRGGRLALTSAGTAFARRITRPMRELIGACEEASSTAASAPMTLTAPPLFARQFLFDRTRHVSSPFDVDQHPMRRDRARIVSRIAAIHASHAGLRLPLPEASCSRPEKPCCPAVILWFSP